MMNQGKKITMAHGSGGEATGELIRDVFAGEFDNEVLNQMEDSAVLPGSEKIAFTTDSFVVDPVEFPGGDIGRLAVCGTVNDLLMRGAQPRYLTCGAILEEGASLEILKRIIHSMALTAEEAGVKIVAGDTKVIQGHGGIYLNTAGIGMVNTKVDIKAAGSKAGDAILVSGTMGDHHAAILSGRMNIQTDIQSDCAPLVQMVVRLIEAGIHIHTLRDITRGGLGTVMKELAEASGKVFELEETKIPVSAKVRDFCGLLGLDPLYMGNEGKLAAIIPESEADKALQIIRGSRYGSEAAIIGRVLESSEEISSGEVYMKTVIGGKRRIEIMRGEGLPRIC